MCIEGEESLVLVETEGEESPVPMEEEESLVGKEPVLTIVLMRVELVSVVTVGVEGVELVLISSIAMRVEGVELVSVLPVVFVTPPIVVFMEPPPVDL